MRGLSSHASGGFGIERATLLVVLLAGLIAPAPHVAARPTTPTLAVQVGRGAWPGTRWSIDLMDMATGELTTLNHEGRAPSWSPDARRIHFGDYVSFGDMRPDGTDVQMTRVVGIPLFFETPKWSPDRSRVVVSAPSGAHGDVYLADLATGTARVLAPNERHDLTPDWSPDGERIVFASDRDVPGRPARAKRSLELFTMTADGGTVAPLTDNAGLRFLSPAWSPDGHQIAYLGQRNDHSMDLFIMNADGSRQKQITEFRSAYVAFPSWSPDGARIVFSAVDRRDIDEGERVYTIDRDGSNLVALWHEYGNRVIHASWFDPMLAASTAGTGATTWGDVKACADAR